MCSALADVRFILVGCHRKVDALGLEVAGGRGEKQRAVIGQALRADDDALLRGGRADEAGDNDKRGRGRENSSPHPSEASIK